VGERELSVYTFGTDGHSHSGPVDEVLNELEMCQEKREKHGFYLSFRVTLLVGRQKTCFLV
jgi:hypothetical protein